MPKKSSKTTKSKKAAPKKVTAKKVSLKKATAKKGTAKKLTPKKSSSKTASTKKYEEAQFLASIKPYALKKNEKYMNAKQKQHFVAILDSWAEQLQIEQDRTADKIQDNVSNFPDESDRATHEEEFTLELRTRERERKLLSKINESIDDLKSNDYGFCASCGIEIGIRRLEARPTATRCIDCKTIEEIHERQQFG
ncbi:MAG: RNA polymerase-binding protein DksA [Gammaproteobacteria bacterium]|jgi:DnaK suppressor protein|nr:MAG: RNA polymerase-binding protein DksA [Gammaproteobacteria bacterium]